METKDLSPIIQVLLLTEECQHVFEVSYYSGLTVNDAIDQSGLLDKLSKKELPVIYGVFGKVVDVHQVLKPGDRVEIYYPLIIHPRDARKLAYAKGKAIGRAKD